MYIIASAIAIAMSPHPPFFFHQIHSILLLLLLLHKSKKATVNFLLISAIATNVK
jgi:hypothetical protein